MSLSFSAFSTFCSRMMFSCPVSPCRYMISRKVRCASVAFWKASKIFLRATVSLFFLLIALKTTAYAPLPSFCVTSYLRRTCCARE